MKTSVYAFTLALLLSLFSCSSSEPIGNTFSGIEQSAESKQRSKTRYLAYEHQVSVDLPSHDIESTYANIVSSCADDIKNHCTILNSSLNSGDSISATIKLRTKPEGISKLIKIAETNGTVANRSTDVEDLADDVINGEKRIGMLKNYLRRLEALENKTNTNIESLIKISSELASAQSDLEHAEGKNIKLNQRIDMDVLHISLFSQKHLSFWSPIHQSITGFAANLSEGISDTITAVAYLIPWFIVLAIVLYAFRRLWRRQKSKN